MPPRPHILIADENTAQTEALCDYLHRFGLQAQQAADASALHRQLADRATDLLVLDGALPGAAGLSLVARLTGSLPVILVGAGAQAIDRVIGLEMGADDFLVKPFEPRELAARIHSVLRRVNAGRAGPTDALPASNLRFDGWLLDRAERRLSTPDGRALPLSEAEFRLLDVLMQAPRRVFSRDQLAASARHRTLALNGRSIDLLVSRLRQKLADDPRAPRWIKTVRGAGYVFDARPVPVAQALQRPAAGFSAAAPMAG